MVTLNTRSSAPSFFHLVASFGLTPPPITKHVLQTLKAEGKTDEDIYTELKTLYNATAGASGDAPPAAAVEDVEKSATTAASDTAAAEGAPDAASGDGRGRFEKHVATLCDAMRHVPREGADDKGCKHSRATVLRGELVVLCTISTINTSKHNKLKPRGHKMKGLAGCMRHAGPISPRRHWFPHRAVPLWHEFA